jgi:cellulose synthase/poly-beta-1,6-N-acetylglucosamine synthase-like glycosyltransferase
MLCGRARVAFLVRREQKFGAGGWESTRPREKRSSMEPAPFVSVVTPFYNTREFLAECIESVLIQTYQNWEYILVDNWSTDGSSQVAEEYASR